MTQPDDGSFDWANNYARQCLLIIRRPGIPGI